MKHAGIRIAMVGLFVAGLAAGALAQGMHWESVMKGGPMGERHEEMWSIPKMMKGVSKETGEAFIVRLDKELFITIDPKEKTYTEMTFAEMERVMKKANSKMDEMQKQLAEMPEEQRKMMEQMMGDKMGAMKSAKDSKVDVKNTGEKKSISGYSCTKFVAMQDGKELMTLWVTKDVTGFDAMRKDWEEFSRRMAAMSPMMGKGVGDAFKKIDGFPIQTEMGHGMTSTVTKIEKKTAPASEFEVPAGYKKEKPKMMDEMEGTHEDE